MKKKIYERPVFGFQEMKLMERVAERCWGYGYAFVDHDADKNTPSKEYWFSESGCDGAQDQSRLDKLISTFPELAGKVGIDDVKVNTKDSTFIDYVGPSK